MIHDPAMGQTRDVTEVFRITEHKGLLRGEIGVGLSLRGDTVFKPFFWYPDGRLSPAQELPHDLVRPGDLDLGYAEPGHRTTAATITARVHAEMIEFDAEVAFDRALDQGDLF